MKRNLLLPAIACAFPLTVARAQSTQSVLKSNQKVVSPLVLYDDFNGRRIDPAKWNNTAGPSPMREAVGDVSSRQRSQEANLVTLEKPSHSL